MSAINLRKFLEDHPEDIAALDDAALFFNDMGQLDTFKIEYKPSQLIRWFAESSPETLRQRIEQFRYAELESEGPYEPITYRTKYRAVIPDTWTGADADAFAAYIEDSGGVNSYYRDLRQMMRTSLNALEEVADEIDDACEQLYEFCKKEVIGFADKLDEMKEVLRAAASAFGVGAVAGAAPIIVNLATAGAVTRPEVLLAILLGLVTMVLTFVVIAWSAQGKWRSTEQDIMQKLAENDLVYKVTDDSLEGYGTIEFT